MGIISGIARAISWDNLAQLFRAYTIAVLVISPLKVIISYPYYKLGLIDNPLSTSITIPQDIANFSNNTSALDICIYYKDVITKSPEVQQFLEEQCGLASRFISSAQSSSIATTFLGTLLILGQMIPDMIKTAIILPYIVYQELNPFVQGHELAQYGLGVITAIWMVIHVVGLASAILFRLR